MICKVCGRMIANEEANFCEYCGASFREMKQSGETNWLSQQEAKLNGGQGTVYQQNIPINQGESVQQRTQQTWKQAASTQGEEKEQPVSFLNWLGTMMLPCIPIIGPITYIVMMFVWAFGKDTNKNKKNWARASLIVTAIGIVAAFFLLAGVVNDIVSSGMTLQDYINSTYPAGK